MNPDRDDLAAARLERLRALTGRTDEELVRETDSITLTLTTCKRPDLLEVTLTSFLRCCTDAERIRRWICVDDDSDPRTRARMRARYPFEYVWKGPDDRGHARSMNILREKVGERATEFVLHLEDDWEFLAPRSLVADAIAILRHDERIGQVVFNRNYAEHPSEPVVGGAAVAGVPGRYPAYVVHEHHPLDSDDLAAYTRRLGRANQAWWPHYSLMPSVLRFGVWRSLGPFDERLPSARFEYEYAERFRDEGWKTAFFPGVHSRHIGRLRSELHDPGKVNAYTLNSSGGSARRSGPAGPA